MDLFQYDSLYIIMTDSLLNSKIYLTQQRHFLSLLLWEQHPSAICRLVLEKYSTTSGDFYLRLRCGSGKQISLDCMGCIDTKDRVT